MAAWSCGIDTISFLSADPEVTSNSSSQIIFTGADADDDNYYGVELFYKIYATESDATTDRSYIISKQNATGVVPGSIVESYLLPSSGLSYQRPVLNDTNDIPSIPKSLLPNSAYFVSMDFPAKSTVEPTVTITNGDTGAIVKAYTLKRNALSATGSRHLSFLEEPIAGAADFRSRATDTDGAYYVQFFAASYGMDYSDFSELYGDAVFLGGLITLNF
jgi:hypothetical protein